MDKYPDFIESTGYGTGEGLCGWNCYHSFSPFIPGISVPTYTAEQLEEMNRQENTPKEYQGKQYTTYQATQRQRRLETQMRAERQKIHLLQVGGADEKDITSAKCRYRATSAEYARFSKAMDLPQQRERVTIDGLGDVRKTPAKVSGKPTSQNNLTFSQDSDKMAIEDKIKWNRKGSPLSPEQKKELREYAQSKGIVITGYSRTDVDVPLMKKVFDEISKMFDRFPELRGTPERPFTLKFANGMDSNDFAMTSKEENNVILLNPNAFRDEKKLQEEYQKLVDVGWFVKGTTCRSVIIHEMGHMYSNINKIDGFEVAKSVLGLDDKNLITYVSEKLSQYSSQNKLEIISEVFSSYYGGIPKQFEKDFMNYLISKRS